MPFADFLKAPNDRDRRRDKKIILHAVVKHIEQEPLRIKPSCEERNLTPPNLIRLFRDFLVAKSLPGA